MRSVNKVILIGNVGNDPEIRSTSSGRRVANVSLATSRGWTDASSGEKKEKTEWHRLSFWGPLADIVEQYVKKGTPLYVEGRIQYSQTEGEGGTRYWTEINVAEMIMLGRASDSATSGGGGGGGFSGGEDSQKPPLNQPDDDLPF